MCRLSSAPVTVRLTRSLYWHHTVWCGGSCGTTESVPASPAVLASPAVVGFARFHRTFLSWFPKIMTRLLRIIFPDVVAKFKANQKCYFYPPVCIRWFGAPRGKYKNDKTRVTHNSYTGRDQHWLTHTHTRHKMPAVTDVWAGVLMDAKDWVVDSSSFIPHYYWLGQPLVLLTFLHRVTVRERYAPSAVSPAARRG